jgi:hypothetical protein
MGIKTFAAVLVVAALSISCKKKAPENIPVPKAGAAETAGAAEPSANKPPPTAVGNYLRTQVGQIQKAKDAKALYEKTEQRNLDSLDLNDTGGN